MDKKILLGLGIIVVAGIAKLFSKEPLSEIDQAWLDVTKFVDKRG